MGIIRSPCAERDWSLDRNRSRNSVLLSLSLPRRVTNLQYMIQLSRRM